MISFYKFYYKHILEQSLIIKAFFLPFTSYAYELNHMNMTSLTIYTVESRRLPSNLSLQSAENLGVLRVGHDTHVKHKRESDY